LWRSNKPLLKRLRRLSFDENKKSVLCKSLTCASSQTHAWMRIKQARQTLLSSVTKQAIHSVWHRAYIDSLRVYQQKKVEISKSDIEALFVARKIKPTAKFCVVPRKASEILSPNNAALVSRLQRCILHRRWKSRVLQRVKKYTSEPTECNNKINSSETALV
jgi:hypothetical protein